MLRYISQPYNWSWKGLRLGFSVRSIICTFLFSGKGKIPSMYRGAQVHTDTTLIIQDAPNGGEERGGRMAIRSGFILVSQLRRL